MKIGVIGNCQVITMADALSYFMDAPESVAIEIWRLKPDEILEAQRKILDCTHIFAQPMVSLNFSPFTLPELRTLAQEINAELTIFHNLYFSGSLPDCRCVGALGHRVKGPVSDYHSEIILRSFLAGKTEKMCLDDLVSGKGVDPKLVWSNSQSQLMHRDAQVDVAFAAEVLDAARSSYSFHYFNHPTTELIVEYARKIVIERIGPVTKDYPQGIKDIMTSYGSWPVLDWVSASLALPYIRDYFVEPFTEQKLDLLEGIERSYAIYAQTPREFLV